MEDVFDLNQDIELAEPPTSENLPVCVIGLLQVPTRQALIAAELAITQCTTTYLEAREFILH